ncbi:hypothetical protein QVD99_006996 [Batrachochytrium dendrobatidis]|nr:hypothetical protein QVD99_006996 [Batrachochytrium dendrobatidis]
MALPRRSMLQHWSHCNTSLFKPIKYPTTIYISTRYMHSLWRPLVLDAMLSKPRQAMPFGSCRLYKKRFYSSDTKMASTIQLPDTHMADAEQQFSSTTSIESSDLSLSPVSLLVNLMDTIHATPLIAFELYSGTPWWLVIVGTTIFLRTMCTLPLAIQNKQRTDRLRKLQPVLMAWESTLGLQLKHGHRTGNLQQDKNYKKMLNSTLRSNPNTQRTSGQIAFRMFMRSFAILMIPISAYVPMAITLYWLASAVYSMLQNISFLVIEKHRVKLSLKEKIGMQSVQEPRAVLQSMDQPTLPTTPDKSYRSL